MVSKLTPIRPAGLIEEAQENGTGRWQLRAEHEKKSLAGDVLRTEDHFTLVAFLIAAWSLSAITASAKDWVLFYCTMQFFTASG